MSGERSVTVLKQTKGALPKRLLSVLMMAVILMSVSACATTEPVMPPLPRLEHGFTPERTITLKDGTQEQGRCMTLDDIRRLDNFLIIVEVFGK